MSSDTTSSNNNLVILALGTVTLAPLSYETHYSIPSTQIQYEQFSRLSWELDESEPIITIDQIQLLQKLNTLKSFSNSIIENSHSLDSETIEIINDNFWDWI